MQQAVTADEVAQFNALQGRVLQEQHEFQSALYIEAMNHKARYARFPPPIARQVQVLPRHSTP